MFIINEGGIPYISTLDTNWCKNTSSISFRLFTGISSFAVVHTRRTNPILINKLLAQDDESWSIFPTKSGCFDIKALVVEVATALEIIEPRFDAAIRYRCTIESISPNNSGLPLLAESISFEWSHFCFNALFISDL